MIRILESILRSLAEQYVRRSQSKQTIVITGSIGKTSTTQAIAHVLRETGHTVISTRYNYNNNLGVPASILGYDLPKNAKNPFAWIWLFLKSSVKVVRAKNTSPYFVLELGTDAPGDIARFSWVKPSIAVVTAVAPEHMEYFKTIENVAKEELATSAYSDKVVINHDRVDSRFFSYVDNDELYHYDKELLKDSGIKKTDLKVIGEHSLDALAAALWVAKHEGLPQKDINRTLASFQSPPGRMRRFEGKYNAMIIDDTYNSSPEAAIAALQYIYSETVNHRIALLGNMNELGESSEELHTQVGEYCNKTKLDLVVTLGPDANSYTAQSAEKNGCSVVRSDTPREAAEVILEKLQSFSTSDKTLVLCKGSQNHVFAEEAVKLLLKNPEDSRHLVRQSARWKKIKDDFWTEV